jgi:small-conductance mechanosensitive channel
MTRPTLAHAAVALISVFPLLVLALHGVQAGSYHPLSQAVSELALGRDGWLMAVAFCSLGTGTLFLAAMLRRLHGRPRVGPWLIGVSGALSYVSAFVHADGPHGTTTHGQIHQAVGVITFLLMISGMFVLVRSLRRDRRYRALATPTLLWAFAAVGGFALIPLSGAAYFGVAQRAFLAIILSWALTVASYGLEAATAPVEATAAA